MGLHCTMKKTSVFLSFRKYVIISKLVLVYTDYFQEMLYNDQCALSKIFSLGRPMFLSI